jgi:hypothetical protein
LGENTKDEMGFALVPVIQGNKPSGQTAFIKYLSKLMEATAYKKLKGVFDEGK